VNNHERKQISYAEASTIADERTIAALIAIGSPALELDENGKVSVIGGMNREMSQAYGVAYLGERNGNLWASMGYPLEADGSAENAQTEIQRTAFNSVEFLEKSMKHTANLALIQLSVVVAFALVIWFSGFDVLITGWISAYIGTWVISPIAGIVLSVAIYGFYKLLELLKRIF
jgi:hypothetical protein